MNLSNIGYQFSTFRPIDTATGQIIQRQTGVTHSANLSSIATRLIKQAAQCEAYSGDFIISWDSFTNKVKATLDLYPETGFTQHEFFGFRTMGVDHLKFIQCRLGSDWNIWREEYFSLYLLEFEMTDNEVIFTLYQAV